MIYVPYKVIMSTDKAARHPIIGNVLIKHPELFSKEHKDWEQLILATWLLYEQGLGKQSFWYPYINLMPDVTFFCDWEESEILACQDKAVATEAIEYKKELDAEYEEVYEVLT